MGANSFLSRVDPILEGVLLSGKQTKGNEVVPYCKTGVYLHMLLVLESVFCTVVEDATENNVILVNLCHYYNCCLQALVAFHCTTNRANFVKKPRPACGRSGGF